MHDVELSGCKAMPMISYLKALGVVRLVSEQLDPSARFYWRSDRLVVSSSCDQETISAFFAEQYKPTPVVAPWNGGSGFYEGDNVSGINAILSSSDPRLQDYRDTIKEIQSWSELPKQGLSIKTLVDEMQTHITSLREGKKKDEFMRLVEDVSACLKAAEPGITAEMTTEKIKLILNSAKKEKGGANAVNVSAVSALLAAANKLRSQVKTTARSYGKEQIVLACRNRLFDRVVEWIDAAVVITRDATLAMPPILGTGANEGRLDYSNTFLCHVAKYLNPSEASKQLLRNALFSTLSSGLEVASVGQYDPGRAGGFNQGNEVETKDFPINPWDFILAIEGCIAWASGISRRLGELRGIATSSFTVSSRAVGYESSADKDQLVARAEIWMPLWARPVSYPELRILIAEGRADVGTKAAKHGIEFAEAVASLGVDRGITAFARYALLKRRGESFVALPTGRFPVQYRRESDLIRELQLMLERVDAFSANSGPIRCRQT